MSRQTRERIGDAFLELYGSKNIGQITVSEVVERAGVSRVTFYSLFDSLEALLREIESSLLSEVSNILDRWQQEGAGSRWKTALQAAMRELCSFIYDHQRTFSALMTSQALESFSADYHKLLRKNLQSVCERRGFEPHHAHFVAGVGAAAVISIQKDWLEDDCRIETETMATLCASMLTDLLLQTDSSTYLVDQAI